MRILRFVGADVHKETIALAVVRGRQRGAEGEFNGEWPDQRTQ